jgi:glycosyltransferase involved in cell wall biosynthesis
MNPLVSVIIPTYNSASYLPQALDSVFNQTFQDYEIIVVDDGSTDETEQVLVPYRELIKYIRKENRGPASARNVGIKHSKGDYIAFLDADDIWLPDKLQSQIGFMKKNPEIQVLFTDCAIFDHQGLIMPSIKERYKVASCVTFEELLTEHFVAMSSIIVKRSCLEEIGLFDETLIGAEDYNLYLRLARKFQFMYLDRVLVYHRKHEKSLSKCLEQMRHDELANLDKIANLFPEMNIPKRKLAAKIYLRFGIYHLNCRELAAARFCFKNTLKHSPLTGFAWFLLAISSLPQSVRDLLIAVNRLRRSL